MKTYCKPATVNIEDWKFNELAVVECFRNKRSRKDFQRLLCKTGKITKREIVEDQLNKDFKRTLEAESEVAKMLTQRIINRDLQLKPIRQFQRIDGLTQKLRDICQESPEQQVFEYIGVYALKPLFRAKILPIQYGSIPNKGGVAGKRKIERLLRKKFHGKVVALKGDVTKAYPSVTVPIVMEMLRRDIGKNKVLLWFLGALMSNYPGNHLCIGGYLPAWLFNYVMSYVLRYIYEQAQIRRGKRNRLVYAIVCYADDFTIYGDVSKLKKAMKKATIWAHDKFGLKIKDIWQFYQIASFDEERENLEERRKGSKKRTPGVDMMGYVVRRKYTIIRGRVFRRIRRQVLRAWEDFKAKGFIPWWRACRIAAYKGWIKHSNKENTRTYTLLQSANFGTLLQMEVGAMMVGKIVNENAGAARRVQRGEEKGYFAFGGSTVIILAQKGSAVPEKRIWNYSRLGIETRVRQGETVGTAGRTG